MPETENYIIGFNRGTEKMKPTLTIGHREGRRYIATKTFTDEEAVVIFEKISQVLKENLE